VWLFKNIGGIMNREFTITVGIDVECEDGREWPEFEVENEIYEMFRVNPYFDAAWVRVKEDPS
jgi:hypothetical protein